MHFDNQQRIDLLRDQAASYLDVALESATKEYPHFPYFIAAGPDSYRLHRELHPAFYGSFDWHSCVEMHWVAVRLMRLHPERVPLDRAKAVLGELLTPENLAAEAEFFSAPHNKSLERPYGWGWLLQLAAELEQWDDPEGRQWSRAVEPLARLLIEKLVEWLPGLTYPQRTGVHPNTAFSLINALVYARRHPESCWNDAIEQATRRFFLADTDYPAHYEPSGADFLSPGLCEAVLMALVLEQSEFERWLDGFLPRLADGSPASLFTPAIISDPTDGQIAHLHGLNLSRAWAFAHLAAQLPPGDPRAAPMLDAIQRHAAASLPAVTGSDYMVEHWLAAYAVLLLSV
jgi:hypothetical protein